MAHENAVSNGCIVQCLCSSLVLFLHFLQVRILNNWLVLMTSAYSQYLTDRCKQHLALIGTYGSPMVIIKICPIWNYHWRRQPWGTGARAPHPSKLPTVSFFWSLQSRRNSFNIRLHVVAYPEKNIQACSFVTVFYMKFIIFCTSHLYYFLLVSCPSSYQILAMPLEIRALLPRPQFYTVSQKKRAKFKTV